MIVQSREPEQIQLNIDEMQKRLNRLERNEWWRWTLAFVVMIALTIGLFALSIPVARNAFDQMQVNIAVRSLLGLVVLFDIFVVHQQMTMKKLRRDLAIQIGVINALESLKVDEEEDAVRAERRRMRRSGLDRRLCVNTLHQGKPSAVYGRIRDICEDGLGAVIPCALHIGEEVTLQFAVDDYQETEVKAVVRHRKSFHYGFEFTSIDPSVRRSISKFVDESAFARS